MELIIRVNYNTNTELYDKFCNSIYERVIEDILNSMNLLKLNSRNSTLSTYFDTSINCVEVYRSAVSNMKLITRGSYKVIVLDENVEIMKAIEYGVKGLEPYPLLRTIFRSYESKVSTLYRMYALAQSVR